MPTPIRLVVNPASGNGKSGRRLPWIVELLHARGIEPRVEFTRSLEHACDLAAEATAAGEVAVAVGGDGVVNAVANAVAGVGGTLGVVPAGRGNDFARWLGVRNVEHAIDVLAAGHVRQLDAGFVAGRYFMAVASVGFDSKVVEAADSTRLVRGSLVYPYACVKALARWKPVRFEIESDGLAKEVKGYSVAIANAGSYGGGMKIAPNASMSDGELDVVVIETVSKARFLMQAPKVYKGAHISNPEVLIWRARSVRVAVDRPLDLYADGESFGPLPAIIEARREALSVVAPDARSGPPVAKQET